MSFEKQVLTAHGMKLIEVGISTNDMDLINEGFSILKQTIGTVQL